jgi:ATP-dependent DNA helicase RecG
MTHLTLEDILALKENSEIEFKKASGENGKGSLPKSFWETYSAFANTNGGDIFLGIAENSDKSLSVTGVLNPEKIRKEIFDLANSRQKISANLLENHSIQEITLDDKIILKVAIPKAHRHLRPVYVGANPLTGTYIRKHEGDYVPDSNVIKKMLVEQGQNAFDSRILKGFKLEDIDDDTLNAYQNIFAARSPNHPFINKPKIEFLRCIGAWGENRENNHEGLTVAGLFMFGKLRSILDEFPNYILDYQEKSAETITHRWDDRITTDGTWSGNIYDFYRKTYLKLVSDLKVPFKLEGNIRKDETPVHEALREALVNTLIHADYMGSVSVLVVKSPYKFEFRNPGLMRIPIEQAKKGGDSDCRNRNLQKMFQLIGAGEQAGSGIPKIYQNWTQQHWRLPKIIEKRDVEQTIFELRMESLISPESLDNLSKIFGESFKTLSEIERMALVISESEEYLDHKRLKDISYQHPADISKTLNNLVKQKFLISQGRGRGTYYILNKKFNSPDLPPNSPDLPPNSTDLPSNSPDLPSNSPDFDLREQEISELARKNKKLSQVEIQKIIIQLCTLKAQTPQRLSQLLNRTNKYIRETPIRDLVKKNKLKYLYPNEINHPRQAYVTVENNHDQ